MVRTTYPDRICYRPGVMIASAVSGQDMLSSGCVMFASAACPPGESGWSCSGQLFSFHQNENSHIRNSSPPTFHTDIPHPEFCPGDVPSSPNIPHSEFCPGDVPPSPNISHSADISGWERRAFQLPWSDISGSANSAHPESFTTILHSATVFC